MPKDLLHMSVVAWLVKVLVLGGMLLGAVIAQLQLLALGGKPFKRPTEKTAP